MSEQKSPSVRRTVRRAAIIGIVLGLLCQALPPEHREICRLVVQFCTAGASH